MKATSAIAQARAAAVLQTLQRWGPEVWLDDGKMISFRMNGLTRGDVDKALDSLAEAGRVSLTADCGQVCVRLAEAVE
jgi:hypothetical protein